jgi:LysR family transcriptional regulator, nitrogen assimilation regulatory protein
MPLIAAFTEPIVRPRQRQVNPAVRLAAISIRHNCDQVIPNPIVDLKQLEYFVRVAELGSFTRASVALDVAQPALSRQVRLLEVELRQNLLTRNGRGAIPNEAGKLLLEHGRGILHQVERAREELGRVRGALAGRVAIGLPPSVTKVLAVPLIREFRRRMPEATLSISEGLTVAMQESLVQGRLDIALLHNALPSPEVEVTPLLDEDLFLVQRRAGKAAATQTRSVPLREIAAMPLVIPTRPNAIRMLVESELANLGLRPQIALEIDGVAAILDLVQDGAGSAVLSRNAVETSAHPRAFTMRPIGSPRLRTQLVVAMSSQRPATLTQKAMLELIQQHARALLASARG